MNFEQKVLESKDLIVKTLQELLQIPSVLDESTSTKEKPFGEDIDKALNYMLELAKKDGFDTVNDEGYAGHISYNPNNSNESVGILCHLDVVPEGTNWTYPPYEAKIVDGKIYARGTTDDKGPTIASYYALKLIKDAGIKLRKEIRIILGTDEETGWRGVAHYFKNYKMPDVGFAPDCSFPLVYGEKGRMSFDLTCDFDEEDIIESISGGERYNVVLDEVKAVLKKDLSKEFMLYAKNNNLKAHVEGNVYTLEGVAAHAMEPEKGINAGTHLCNFLKDYSNNKMVHFVAKYFHNDYNFNNMNLSYNDYEMGLITVNIGIMNISKDETRVTLDSRYPVRYDLKHFYEEFNKFVKSHDIEITNQTCKEPHYVSPEEDLVKLLYNAYSDVTGDTINKPFTVGGGTYASTMEKGVAFGMGFPGEEELAHQRNEYLSIDSLLKGVLIYIKAILLLGEVDA